MATKHIFDIREYVKHHLTYVRKRQQKMRHVRPAKRSMKTELGYKHDLLKVTRFIEDRVEKAIRPILTEELTFAYAHRTGDALPARPLRHEVPKTSSSAESGLPDPWVSDLVSQADAMDALIAEAREHTELRRTFTKLIEIAGDLGKGIDATAQRLSLKYVMANLSDVDKRLTKSLLDSVGVDISVAFNSDQVRPAMEKALANNLALIKSIPSTYIDRVGKTITKNFVDGVSIDSIWQDVQRQGHISEDRAKLIARDQTSKMNSAFNEARQTAVGIDEYVWSGVMDERERETHIDNEGKIFRWDTPPDETGNPGDDVNCRCTGNPYFDLDALQAEVDAEEQKTA